LARREPLVVEDIQEDARFERQAGRYETGSFAVAPLAVGARAIGVLCAADPVVSESFRAEDLSLLRILGAQISQLIEGVGPASQPDLGTGLVLHAEGTDPRAARVVREVCDAVTAEVEPERVLAAALKPVADGLHAAPVSIYLTNQMGELVLEAEMDGGLRGDRERLPPGGIAGAVMAGGPPVASGDPTGDPRFVREVDTPADGIAGPLICAPLRFRGKPLGVLRVFPGDACDAIPELAEVASAALSVAVRNVLLYRSLVETIDEVANARREAARLAPSERTD
ncbi:MAG: GAF domain-containing protein, partial [Myxococcota bacterium]